MVGSWSTAVMTCRLIETVRLSHVRWIGDGASTVSHVVCVKRCFDLIQPLDVNPMIALSRWVHWWRLMSTVITRLMNGYDWSPFNWIDVFYDVATYPLRKWHPTRVIKSRNRTSFALPFHLKSKQKRISPTRRKLKQKEEYIMGGSVTYLCYRLNILTRAH